MFTRNKITSVVGSKIQTANAVPAQALAAHKSRGTQVNASVVTGGGYGAGSHGMAMTSNWSTQYQYYMTGLLPAEPGLNDATSLSLFYRDCYLFDNVAGSAVDIQSSFPFSDFDLRGLDVKQLDIFNDALSQLDIQRMLPEISTAYLVDGFFCGSLVFDSRSKKFIDTLIHDALQCAITPSPFFNMQPEIRVSPSSSTMRFLGSDSPFTRAYRDSIPDAFLDMMKQGQFILNPVSTMFIARRSLTDRAYVSFLHRILPMYLIEKTMFRGTLVEAGRRQRAMTHITAGDDIWTPSGEELQAYVQAFQAAEFDPLGGWVSTRNAVSVADVRPGGDFWKWTDMADVLVPYKLRALGISESFLSGDACLIGSTSIALSDGTTQTIEDMCPVKDVEPSQLPVGTWYPLELEVPNRVTDTALVGAWSYQGCKDTLTLSTEDGKEITATDNHPFWVLNEITGEACWKRLDELVVGDLVAVRD